MEFHLEAEHYNEAPMDAAPHESPPNSEKEDMLLSQHIRETDAQDTSTSQSKQHVKLETDSTRDSMIGDEHLSRNPVDQLPQPRKRTLADVQGSVPDRLAPCKKLRIG